MKEYAPNIIETEDTIYEYDEACIKCKNSPNFFILLACFKFLGIYPDSYFR